MSLTFFHRMEQQDLDGTDDFSAGDTTGAHNGSPLYDTAAVRIGTNGLLVDGNTGDRTTFAAASIISPTLGAVAFWFQFPTAFPTSGSAQFFYAAGTNANDYIRIESVSGGGASNRALRLSTRNNGGATENVTLDDNELTSGAWYFVVIQWDSATPARLISVYDTSGTLLDSVSSAVAWTAPADLINIHFGDLTGATGTIWIDNAFIGSAYADGDTFVTNREITSYTAYSAGGASRVHLLTGKLGFPFAGKL